jgi:hypothetical protein
MLGCYRQIYRHFAGRVSIGFGRGTNFTSTDGAPGKVVLSTIDGQELTKAIALVPE